jgi:hypothetical protein
MDFHDDCSVRFNKNENIENWREKMASVFLGADETFSVANSGTKVFGQTGTETVNILEEVTGVVLDGNIDEVVLDGIVADFRFLQQGNLLAIMRGEDIVATIPVQVDENGTLLTFNNGSLRANFAQGAVIEMGGTPVSSDEPGRIIPGDGSFEEAVAVELDTEAFPAQLVLDAEGGAFTYIDDATEYNQTVINNFSTDDTISFVNADVGDYFFSSQGEDVTISYNYEGTISVIQLTGVIDSGALVNDLASFTDAVGFDAFG